jgi:hypothetical protein
MVMHLRREYYEAALRGEVAVEALLRQAAEHLGVEDEISFALASPMMASGDPENPLIGDIEEAKRDLSRRQAIARAAREDLSRLLDLPSADWRGRVSNTRTRMRSRAFAELLLGEAEARLLRAPEEARLLAELVPLAMRWTTERHDEWRKPLLERASYLRRIAGGT